MKQYVFKMVLQSAFVWLLMFDNKEKTRYLLLSLYKKCTLYIYSLSINRLLLTVLKNLALYHNNWMVLQPINVLIIPQFAHCAPEKSYTITVTLVFQHNFSWGFRKMKLSSTGFERLDYFPANQDITKTRAWAIVLVLHGTPCTVLASWKVI